MLSVSINIFYRFFLLKFLSIALIFLQFCFMYLLLGSFPSPSPLSYISMDIQVASVAVIILVFICPSFLLTSIPCFWQSYISLHITFCFILLLCLWLWWWCSIFPLPALALLLYHGLLVAGAGDIIISRRWSCGKWSRPRVWWQVIRGTHRKPTVTVGCTLTRGRECGSWNQSLLINLIPGWQN